MLKNVVELAPFGDRSFAFLDDILAGKKDWEITTGNWQIIIAEFVVMFLAMLVSLIYAECFISEKKYEHLDMFRPEKVHMIVPRIFPAVPFASREEALQHVMTNYLNQESIRQRVAPDLSEEEFKQLATENLSKDHFFTSVKRVLTKVPGILFYATLTGIVMGISSFSFFLLGVFYICAFYFVPILMVDQRLSLPQAFGVAWHKSRNYKFIIFRTYCLMFVVFFMFSDIALSLLFTNNQIGYVLGNSFIFALRSLVMGRLCGLLYLLGCVQKPYLFEHR